MGAESSERFAECKYLLACCTSRHEHSTEYIPKPPVPLSSVLSSVRLQFVPVLVTPPAPIPEHYPWPTPALHRRIRTRHHASPARIPAGNRTRLRRRRRLSRRLTVDRAGERWGTHSWRARGARAAVPQGAWTGTGEDASRRGSAHERRRVPSSPATPRTARISPGTNRRLRSEEHTS